MKKLILLLACLCFLINCSSEDDSDEAENFIGILFQPNESMINYYMDYGYYSVSEFPFVKDGDTLGFAKVGNISPKKIDSENVNFMLTEEYPVGAFAVDQNTGYVTVKNAMLLDTRKIDYISFSIEAKGDDLIRVIEKKYVLTKLSDVIVIGIDSDEYEINYTYENGSSNANYYKYYDLRGVKVNNGTALATLVAKPLIGKTQYSLQEIIPEGAVEIDNGSGVIRVKDEKLFNSKLYPKVSFKVELKVEHKESDRTWTERIDWTVFLSNLNQELCGINNTYSLYNPVYDDFGNIVTPLNLLPNLDGQALVISTSTAFDKDEFSFIPKKDLQLCSVLSMVSQDGDQKTNYFELLNDKGDLLVGDNLGNSDGWGYLSNYIWVSLPYVLKANEKYTLRRIKNKIDGENSFITAPSGTSFNFPVNYEDLTITGSKFYKDGVQLDVTGIPLINLSFVK